jgi:uncharacterized protein (TIGR02646 family)
LKFIQKNSEPPLLRRWRLENKRFPLNLRYRNIPSSEKAELRSWLLSEQGHLCGYSMMRISSAEHGHIEHVRPQSRQPDLGVAYSNMIYCYPGNKSPRCAFGAHAKNDIEVSSADFVSPLDPNCEARFSFDLSGMVKTRRSFDKSVESTIRLLCLNNEQLKKARVAAIRAFPIFKSIGSGITAAEARKLADRVMRRDSQGRFPPFAVAVHQVVLKYAEQRAAKEAGLHTGSFP